MLATDTQSNSQRHKPLIHHRKFNIPFSEHLSVTCARPTDSRAGELCVYKGKQQDTAASAVVYGIRSPLPVGLPAPGLLLRGQRLASWHLLRWFWAL
jgi:hypothetical protein